MDESPRRPFDHQIEPFFAGLGLEQRPAARRGARAASVLLLTLLAGFALVWWLS